MGGQQFGALAKQVLERGWASLGLEVAGAPLGEPSPAPHQLLSLSPWPWQLGWTLGTPRPSPQPDQPASSAEASLAAPAWPGKPPPPPTDEEPPNESPCWVSSLFLSLSASGLRHSCSQSSFILPFFLGFLSQLCLQPPSGAFCQPESVPALPSLFFCLSYSLCLCLSRSVSGLSCIICGLVLHLRMGLVRSPLLQDALEDLSVLRKRAMLYRGSFAEKLQPRSQPQQPSEILLLQGTGEKGP